MNYSTTRDHEDGWEGWAIARSFGISDINSEQSDSMTVISTLLAALGHFLLLSVLFLHMIHAVTHGK